MGGPSPAAEPPVWSPQEWEVQPGLFSPTAKLGNSSGAVPGRPCSPHGPPLRAAGWYDGAFLLLLGVKRDQRLLLGLGWGRCEGSRSFWGLWVCGGSCARHTSAPPSPSSLRPPLSSQQTAPPAGAPQSLARDVTEICTQKATQLTLCVNCLDFTRVNPYQTQPLPLGSHPKKLQP